MGYNIEWAHPEVTQVYSFQGRLYRTYKKAALERGGQLEHKLRMMATNPPSPYYVDKVIPPIYRVNWTWEEIDAAIQ